MENRISKQLSSLATLSILTAFLTAFLTAVSSNASAANVAAEFGANDLMQATQVALKMFSDASPGHVVHITGFKTWKSGADAKVRVYMTHDGMAMETNYQCTGAGNQIRCTAL